MVQDAAMALSAMLRAVIVSDHDELLQAADAAIKANKDDWTAHHIRVVALLKLDRFDEAVVAVSQAGAKLETQCVVEHAYALYKTGHLQEAASAIESSDTKYSRSGKHVLAQVAYRAQRFQEAQAIYDDLVAADAHTEAADIGINVEAIQTQLRWHGQAPAASSICHDDSFELCYNRACHEISRAALTSAATLLQRSAKLCEASDQLTNAERTCEQRPIVAQKAYVDGRMGNLQQALHLCRSIDAPGTNLDPDLALIVQNNMAAFEMENATNPFLLARHTAVATPAAPKTKLYAFQSAMLARNSALVHLWLHKVAGVRHATRNTMAQALHPTTDLDTNAVSVLNAAADTRGLNSNQVMRRVAALVRKHPNNVALALLKVHLCLSRGKPAAALSALGAFLDHVNQAAFEHVRFSPGLVALFVALMRVQGRRAAAKLQLAYAASFWCRQPGSGAASLLHEAGIELAKSSDALELSLAASAFDKLNNHEKSSPIVSAGLVAAAAVSNLYRVEQHVSQLPSVKDLTGSVDADSLVNAGIAIVPRRANSSSKRLAPLETIGQRAIKKRPRTRLPKSYVEGKKPDPERWLPLRDRLSYRPKGRKGKKKASEATQGGFANDDQVTESLGLDAEKPLATASSKRKKKAKRLSSDQ